MKKRLLSLVLVLCMVLTLLPQEVFAADIVGSGTCGDNLTWTLDSNGLLTISGTGPMYGNFNYSGPWYDLRDTVAVTTVVIESGVTSIGKNAFTACKNLKIITISDTVTTIGDWAFHGCTRLPSITIPGSVISIGHGAFRYCDSLSSVTITNGVERIGTDAFEFCHSLKTVTIPSSVISMDESAFGSCGILTEINVSNGNAIFKSENGVLFNKAGTKLILFPRGRTGSYTIPQGVAVIGDSAFSVCRNLTSVRIPAGVTTIGTYAFAGCWSLEKAEFPKSLTTIGEYAFSNCDVLSNVVIPENVTSIGNYAFEGCNGITSITIPENVTSIGNNAFQGCDEITSITILSSGTSMGKSVFEGCYGLTEATILGNITRIGESTFSRCESLKTVTIPLSVTSMGLGAFYECDSLTDIYYEGNEDQWKSISFGSNDKYLADVTIHYGYGGSGSSLPDVNLNVHESNVSTLEAALLQQMDGNVLLPDISFGNDTIRGPSITVAGQTFYLFELESKFDINLHDRVKIQFKVDTKEKTVKGLVGYKPIKDSAEIGGDPNGTVTNNYWESYREIKSLYKTVANGITNRNTLNRFNRLYNKLQPFNADMVIGVEGLIAGYLEFSYETGKLEFSEGGAILQAKVNTDLSQRIPSFPAAYATLKFELSTDDTIQISKGQEKLQVDGKFNLGFETAIGLGLGKNGGKLKAYVEGGLVGNLDATATTKGLRSASDDPLAVTLTGSLYVEGQIGPFKDENRWPLAKFGLYPKLENLSNNKAGTLSTWNTLEEFVQDAEPIQRLYLEHDAHPILLSGVADDYSFRKAAVYPYNYPELLALSNGDLLMVWLDDLGNKSDNDRTTLLYSVFSGGVWSEPAPIYDNGAYNDHPVLYQNGDQVFLLWSRADSPWQDDWEDMTLFEHMELCFSEYDAANRQFTEPVVITENNGLAELEYTLTASDDTVTAAWVENSENDLFMGEGENTIYTRSCANGVWSDVQSVYTAGQAITDLSLSNENGWTAAFTLSNAESTSSWQIRSGDAQATELGASTDSVQLIDGHTYYLQDTELYCDGVSTGLSGISNYDVIGGRAILALVPTGLTCEMFASYYDPATGSWGGWTQLTGYDKYIRSYSAVLDDDGELVVAMNLVDVDVDAEQVYGDAELVVVADPTYSDLVVNDTLFYDDSAVVPGETFPLEIEITNNSRETLNSVSVKLTAFGQTTTQDCACALAPGETGRVTASLTLPQTLHNETITAQATPLYSGAESRTDNNTAEAEIGFANLTLSATDPAEKNGTFITTLTVENVGCEPGEAGTITVFNGNAQGDVLETISVPALNPGARKSFVYEIPENLWTAPNEESMNALQFELSADAAEIQLADNSARIAFDSLSTVGVTVHPENAAANVGETATFKVAATGTGLTYQWQYKTPSGSAWKNCTSKTDGYNAATLKVEATAARNGYQYRCVITDASGSKATSDAATLTVKTPSLKIVQQPEDYAGSYKDWAEFFCVAEGEDVSYYWQYSTDGGETWNDSDGVDTRAECYIISKTKGRLYRCTVSDKYGNEQVSNIARVIMNASVITQPKSVSANAGETASFKVKADANEQLTYQWQYKTPSGAWKNSSSATKGYNTDTLQVQATAARNGYQYRCVVTDASGNTVTSDAATLTVKSGLAITTQPADQSVVSTAKGTFKVTATGTGLTYQWQYMNPSTGAWKNCSSATKGYNTATLTVAGVSGSTNRNGYQYRCIVTDASGNQLTSNAAKLTVFAIKTQPKAATAVNTGTASFKVSATGTGLTYQWQYMNPSTGAWKNCSSATKGYNTATLTVAGVSGTTNRNGYQYRCVVTDDSGKTVTSDAAKLTVFAIKTQPKAATAVNTGTASFKVSATGSGLTYQWQYLKPGGSWKNCSSATKGYNTATLTVQGVSGTTNRNGYQYRCLITDANGNTLTSAAATLTVFAIKTQPTGVTAAAGTTAKFKVAATGSNLTYQWQYKNPATGNWKNCSAKTAGYNTATLKVSATAGRNGYQYRCIVTSGTQTLTTNAATLTVK